MPFVESYRRWRGDRPERRLPFLVSSFLASGALALFPAQDLPILNRVDSEWFGTALTLLAVGAFFASERAARGKELRPFWFWFSGPVLVSMAIVGFGLFVCLSIGGVGTPSLLDLAMGPLWVGLASVCGAAVAQLSAIVRTLSIPALGLFFLAVGLWVSSEAGPLVERYQRADQTCLERNDLTYCANPGYEPLVAKWAPVVEAVLSLAPPGELPPPPPVVQETEEPRPSDALAVPSSEWGRGGGAGIAEVTLALDVADWVVGAEQGLVVGADPEEPRGLCDLSGQARAIVQMWMAGRVSEGAERVLIDPDFSGDTIGGSYAEFSGGGSAEYASQLLVRPDDEVAATIAAHWDELVDPGATFKNAWRTLDLEPEPGDAGVPTPFDPDDPEAHMPPCA